MKPMIRPVCLCAALLVAAIFVLALPEAHGAVTVLGVQYQQDELFPEYNCIWHDKDYPTSCSGTYLGGNVHVYLKNTGGSSVTISDLTLAGYSLTTILPVSTAAHNANSIYFYWDNRSVPSDIVAAGIPVWFKGDPTTIPAGGVGQAVVRLRFPPTTPTVTVGVVTTGGSVTTNITISANAPQLASVGFSEDRAKVYLHWRRSGGAAPDTILMDGVDVTANTTTVGDTNLNFAESVLTPASPLAYLSYHVFQGVYADGKKATASLRAWSHPFIHAPWGVFDTADATAGRAWLEDCVNRGLNAVQNQYGGGVGTFLASPTGGSWMLSRGFGVIVWNGNTSRNTLLSFIDDEVDAEEDNVGDNFCGTGKKIPCGSSPMGILGLRSIATGEDYRRTSPNAPTTINMDGTFKPENYYAYGQAVDVLQADPYYQKRLKDTYWYHNPAWVPLYNKATYIYAVSKACTRAAEPNPFHVILQSTESKESVNGTDRVWPFAPPQCKRIEAYYAVAAGAKGISYWWFKPCGGYCSNGLGDQSTQAARDVWKEMGLYGNELKTVSPLLVASHPVDLPLGTSANVWARALAVGTDTVILLVVNDNYYNDEAGFHSTDVANATVTVPLPAWMQTGVTGFQVAASGLSDVSTQRIGNQLQVNLGTLKITRMIVLTRDGGLRATIQQRYDTEVRPGICAIAPELCVNTPPSIAMQPISQFAAPGGVVEFTAVVSGASPLAYQWQKNTVKLNNGGHYSGCTAATLTVSGANSSDVASYRCVVTNAFGSVTSSVATLVLGSACANPTLLNGSFEGPTNALGVSTNWVGYQRAPNPTTTWTIQIASPPPGGGTQYQQIQNSPGTGGGGVRQDITGCTIGATYQISGWMRGNSTLNSTCTVKVSPSASTNWSTALDLNPPQTMTGNSWTNFSGTVVATGTSMTLWLDGNTPGGTANKAECFDAVTVTCLAAPPPLRFDAASLTPTRQVQLVLSGEPGKSVTVRHSSNLMHWVVLTNVLNPEGVIQVTDPWAGDAVQRFYRATSP
jgi:hypothetical protein